MSQLKNVKLAKHVVVDEVPSTKQKVKLTPFRVGDEKVLLMASESKDEKQMIRALKQVVDNCSEGCDVETLATFDLEYLFLKLRAISVGEISEIGITCTHCQKPNKIPVQIDNVKVHFNPNHKKLIKIADELAFEMKYVTLDEVSDYNFDNADSLIDLIAHSIEKVYYGEEIIQVSEDEISDLKQILEDLTTTQFKQLQDFFETSPKLSKNIEFVCGECGTENKQTIEGLANFF